MKCPKCGYEDSKVVDSRPSEDVLSIRRRRECIKCSYRFTTYEKIDQKPILVIKRNGSVEPFDEDKLFRGVLISCAKRPVDTQVIENLISDIINDLRSNGKEQIESKNIGEMVLERLSKIDQVAFVRFASVYKEFSNINEFKEALKDLK